jgi:hypothetical protein
MKLVTELGVHPSIARGDGRTRKTGNLDSANPRLFHGTDLNMAPTKTHRPTAGGIVRTHSRTTSGPKPGLNLTQKDPGPPKHTDSKKKAGHVRDV